MRAPLGPQGPGERVAPLGRGVAVRAALALAARRIALVVLAAALLAAPSECAANAVGLVEEYPVHANVGDIAAGPEGNLWFTLNTPSRHNERNGIGRITPRGEVTRFRAGLSPQAEPTSIVAGPDGNLWFTYDRGLGVPGGGVGRVTPQGEITEFPEPPGVSGSPFEIVAGPDGNLWYQRGALFGTTSGGLIGRITPQGEISTFGAGLRSGAAVTHLVAGPDGNVWFADDSSKPAIGRITPAGEVTEFGGIPPRSFPILEGPTPGPDGKLWFSANEPTTAVERISTDGTIERFRAGLDRRAEFVGPFTVGSDRAIWFRVEKSPPRHAPGSERGRTAIGRITVDGEITEFHHCLRPMPQFAGPNFLTLGPDGNVWFTTWPSGEDAYPTRASTPSIGRITPAGKITEFRLGLHRDSRPEELTAAGGSLWFLDRDANAVGRIVPPRKPPNTFLVLEPRRTRGSAVIRLPIVTPGPGALRLHMGGRRTIRRRAHGCGTTVIPVRRRAGVARITFTPRRGSPYTRRIELR